MWDECNLQEQCGGMGRDEVEVWGADERSVGMGRRERGKERGDEKRRVERDTWWIVCVLFCFRSTQRSPTGSSAHDQHASDKVCKQELSLKLMQYVFTDFNVMLYWVSLKTTT